MKSLTLLIVMVVFGSDLDIALSSDGELRKALEIALVNDTANLVALQNLLYPPETAIVDGNVRVEYIRVRNLTELNPVPDNPTAFWRCSTDYYCLFEDSIPLSLSGDANAISHFQLLNYISSNAGMSFLMGDYVSFRLFDFLTLSQVDASFLGNHRSSRIHFDIDQLSYNPSLSELLSEVKYTLSWAKYYARTSGPTGMMNTERKDSDRMIVQLIDYKYNDYHRSVENPAIVNVILLYTMNSIIAIVGIYWVPKLLQQAVSYCKRDNTLLTMKEFGELYCATVIICAIISITCTVIQYSSNSLYTDFFVNLMPLLLFYFLIFVIEVVSFWFAAKGFELGGGNINHYVLRAIHTLAFCHILWFLHRVGCNLLVATIFIAIAPAQTLAAIFLIYFVILSSILYLALNLHFIRKMKCSCKSCCPLFCKFLVLSVLYTFTAAFLGFLTLFFNDLARNGLTSSGLGSVILSLVAPTIVFLITLKLKKHVEKYFVSSEAGSDELYDPIEGRVNVDIDADTATVNTPLVANRHIV